MVVLSLVRRWHYHEEGLSRCVRKGVVMTKLAEFEGRVFVSAVGRRSAVRRTPVSALLVVFALLVTTGALGVSGCAGSDTASTVGAPQSTATTLPAGPEAAGGSDAGPDSDGATTTALPGEISVIKGDSAVWGEGLRCKYAEQGISLIIVLAAPEEVPDSEMGMSDPELNRLLALPVSVENAGDRPTGVIPDWFELEGDDGTIHKRARLTDSPVVLLAEGSIAPGGTVSGRVVFELPEGVEIVAAACDMSLGAKPDMRLTWSD